MYNNKQSAPVCDMSELCDLPELAVICQNHSVRLYYSVTRQTVTTLSLLQI